MSKVKITGNASGTGVLTIEAPNTNTDRTISLPDSTGELISTDASGNVGIGASSVSQRLDVQASTVNTGMLVYNTNTASGASVPVFLASESGGSTTNVSVENASSGNMIFRTGATTKAGYGTERMRITGAGALRLGTTIGHSAIPSKVSLKTDIDQNGIGIVARKNINTYYYYMNFVAGTAAVGWIYSSTTSTTFATTSDYRLKENVVPMSGSIDRLKELKPSRFNFIADATTTVDGFLAHEAQAVVPEAVTGTKDAMKMEEYEVTPAVEDDDGNVITEAVMGEREVPDMQGIDQSKLVPLLTSALQDAIAKIEQLESRISALEVN